MTKTIVKNIRSRIIKHGRGWCFTAKDFHDIGGVEVVKVTLHRLEKDQFIRRLSQGLYDYPKVHIVLGNLWPTVEEVAKALARKYQINLQPSGAYAANLLGLTDQVPGKVVYLTEGDSKKMRIGKSEIIFKKTTPKNMKTAGRISGIVFQALKHLGKEHIDEKKIAIIKNKLTSKNKKELLDDLVFAPAWISVIVKEKMLKDSYG